jgi:hypothetical protein
MGFSLYENDGSPPSHPHLLCAGAADLTGRGWAWHDDPRRRGCFSDDRDVAASAEVVSRAIGPSGIDAMLAMADIARDYPGTIPRIFRRECTFCGANHLERAKQCLRAVGFVHPKAVSAIREARVPERYLMDPLFQEEIAVLPKDVEKLRGLVTDRHLGRLAKRALRLRNNLPVWKRDPDRTRLVQIAYAHAYRLKKGF